MSFTAFPSTAAAMGCSVDAGFLCGWSTHAGGSKKTLHYKWRLCGFDSEGTAMQVVALFWWNMFLAVR